ncbi:anaerobic ribonucleoside-triphosphate reductase activating protein [Marinimicrobium sp. LS-A18]|uniref:anaerobic ribonucleoside-triphosphate reductase activating protein n=1 Tax=Marinimicrobium sp. LS-A18 TaxID=1381596 RepID=UPI0009DC2259|nr:anaerobic ribonucleoside-triphosphate reductase activating protein [Marinimicrobium sp. LS-A18]
MLRYLTEDVVFQEVPGEVSLAYTVTGCPLRCPSCHSADSWDPQGGRPLTPDFLIQRLKDYRGLVTCVLFFGGEWQPCALLALLAAAQRQGVHRCLYTGLDTVEPRLRRQLTFLKTGPWVRELGGLDSPTTNQRLIDLRTGAMLNHHFQGGHSHASTHTTPDQSETELHSGILARG